MATNRKYAFLMVEYETPEVIKRIHDKLSEEDLYKEEDSEDYGIETESHVTLVPCLDNDVDLDEIKKMLEPLDQYDVILTNVSKFDNDKYDVLKCDAVSMQMFNTYNDITSKFATHSEHKGFHPHMTIAYVKVGVADKYVKDILEPLVIMKAKNFHFSYVDENGNEKDEKWK